MAKGLEVKGHISHFQKREKRGCRTMSLLLPLFGKHLEKAEFLAWKAKIIIKAKEKRSCLKPNDIFFFICCHFWKIYPHSPSSLKACSSFSVLSLGLPPPFSSPHTMICNPQISSYWGPPPHALSGPLKKIVLTTHSYASALIRLWDEIFILASFPTQSQLWTAWNCISHS